MKKLIGLLLLFPVVAIGDNRAAIQSLQSEPASLLDISLLRLQAYIEWTRANMVAEYNHSAQAEIRHMDINANYLPEKARINVSYLLSDTNSSPENMQAGCKRVLHISKINLLKSLPGLFIHEDRSWPPGLEESSFNLANLIELDCVIYGNSSQDVYYKTSMPLALGADE